MKRIFIMLLLAGISLLGAEIVLEESFDSAVMPAGWTQVYEEGNISWMPNSGGHNGNPPNPHTGARNAYIFAESCRTKLVTPMLNIGGSTNATLTFWHAHLQWLGQQDILKIYYKTEPGGNWTLIETYDYNQSTWEYESISLPFESSSYYVAFEAVCDWGHGVVVDDIVIEGEPSPVGVLEGHVYNENGIPLTGAEVLIEDISMSTVSEPGGFYQILSVPEGNHPLFASLDGYGFDMTTATIVAGQTVTVDFYLVNYIELMVTGTVVTEISGEPVQGATVTLEGFSNYQAQTAANGQFIIPGVWSNNEYDLTVSKNNYNPYEETIVLQEENYNCGTLSIFAPVSIEGFVNTTATPDSGLANAQVTLSGFATHNVQTAANGQFLITDVYANETYQISVEFDNHNPYEAFVDVEAVDMDLGTLTLVSPVSLTGHVVANSEPETGLAGAEVELSGYASHSAITDSLGDFVIEEIYANETYQIEIDYPDHNIYTQTVNINSEDLDLGTITLIGPVNVSGYIYGSDDLETGLAGAEIELDGAYDYDAVTDSTGYYLIEGVFANSQYSLSVTAEGYNGYETSVTVTIENLALEDIILQETTMPAGNVSAQIVDENSTFITWNTPGSSSTYEFRYDDGNPVGQIGLNGQTFPDHVIGATHEYYAVVRRVEWFLTNNHTHPTVKIYIFGLTPSGLPDSDDLLYESGNISNVNNQWRSYTLPEAVVAPNGFLVGIATPNRWTDLAMDDGDDEPWVFENGTQYSTTNWENGVWSDISGFPDAGNLLLRAYGLNLGPPIGRDLEGYNVYRLPENNVNQPEEWELVAENIQDTTYTDSTWWYLDEGEWFYAVRCHHTNGIISIPSFSNILEKDDPPTYTVDLWITDSAGSPLRYVLTSLTSFYHTYAANSDIEGLADYAAVNPGIYDLHVTRNGYEDYDLEDILITENLEMDITLVSTGEDHNVVEKTTSLTGIYPNPFNPQTEIGFELAKADEVRIEVYNLKGQKVADLLNEVRSAGSYSINWNADDQPSGIYMIRFRAGGINQMQKAVLLK